MSEKCKSLVLQDKCNIEIFLSPVEPGLNWLLTRLAQLCRNNSLYKPKPNSIVSRKRNTLWSLYLSVANRVEPGLSLAVKTIHYLTLCMLRNFFMIFCHLLIFLDFFPKKFLQEYHQCQTVWIQIRPDILSGLIWAQTVCKDYHQATTVNKELKIPIGLP